ncbi:hypothetical protein [Sphaerimonospora thailandensis]|uniref:HTH cro/C1-type domain-containing protein n=1 Tax=Sphaerimonospora thailandensis TaxID=795644 RepID=A0A8J3R8G7_9ACTN|nr:hypothetical protein [Sphaerimonospora thailandensis]GIH70300.1 hypothetical protein Mth01_25530 [Sphaerimonospora thailandensis]
MGDPHPLVVHLMDRRRQLRLSQRAVAPAAGVKSGSVGLWELGQAQPRLTSLAGYALALRLRLAVVDPWTRETLSSDPATLMSAAAAHRRRLDLLQGQVARLMRCDRVTVRRAETGHPRLWLGIADRYVTAVGLKFVLVYDRPRCCRCDPWWCEKDEEHCATQACPRCMHGCPAPEGECCERAGGAAR